MSKRKVSSKSRGIKFDRGATANRSIWIYGWHTVRAALGNPDRESGRLLTTAEAAARIGGEFPTVSPEIVTRDALGALLPKGAVHQGIALHAPPRRAAASSQAGP